MKRILSAFAMALACLSAVAQNKVVYTSADNFPVYGKATENTSARYERLPEALRGVTRKPVWDLGECSAGLFIRFRSDSPSITARWENNHKGHMPHMTDVGDNGLDLYAMIDGEWRFVGSGFAWGRDTLKTRKIVGNMDPVMREYMLYLPLYDGIKTLEIGVEEGSVLDQPAVNSPSNPKPIVMYGTSILQGGCANRPGMAFTNIIGRKLDREVINLGFSGNALLDYEIAELMAQVEDPALYVLDYVPNASADSIRTRAVKFFRIIRDAHPDVPVIFVEDPQFPHIIVDNKMREEVTSKNEAQKEIYRALKEAGEKNIWYVSSEGMSGDDGEAFVDGVHFTDLGMVRYTEHILPTIRKALKKSK